MEKERVKGSYKRMSELVDKKPDLIEEIVGEKISWICPKDGKERQLNSKDILKRLGLDENLFEEFWPKRSPQWDGMFIAKDTATLYLIEAKSHLTEISSGNRLSKECSEDHKKNYLMKCKTLRSTMSYFNVMVDDNIWLHKYYQISNRIAFHLKVKEKLPTDIINNVKLIFLNFVNDPDWKEEKKQASENDWEKKYNKILKEMGLTYEQFFENDIFIWNIDADKLI